MADVKGIGEEAPQGWALQVYQVPLPKGKAQIIGAISEILSQRRVQSLTLELGKPITFTRFVKEEEAEQTKRLEEEGRLIHTDFPADWDRYDLTEILFKPEKLDIDEYAELMRVIASRLYSRRASLGRFLRSLKDTRSLRTSIWCLMASRLYRVPGDHDPKHGQKFWYLNPKSLPVIELYRRLEKVF